MRLSLTVMLLALVFFPSCNDSGKEDEEKKGSSWSSSSVKEIMEACAFGGKSVRFCECSLDIYKQEFLDFEKFDYNRDMLTEHFEKVEDLVSSKCSSIKIELNKKRISWSYEEKFDFIDFLCRGESEPFIDSNGNGKWDRNEDFTDLNNNGVRDEGKRSVACECLFAKFSEVYSYLEFQKALSLDERFASGKWVREIDTDFYNNMLKFLEDSRYYCN